MDKKEHPFVNCANEKQTNRTKERLNFLFSGSFKSPWPHQLYLDRKQGKTYTLSREMRRTACKELQCRSIILNQIYDLLQKVTLLHRFVSLIPSIDQLCFVSTAEEKIRRKHLTARNAVGINREAYRRSPVSLANKTILRMLFSVETAVVSSGTAE